MTNDGTIACATANVAGADLILAQAPVDDALVDEVVEAVNRLYVAKGLEVALAIGRSLIDRIFGGDPEQFRDAGRANASFRKLSQRADLRVSHSFLWYACAVVAQVDELPDDLREALPLSHHRALVPLRDAAAKAELARRAVDEEMTKRQLEKQVRLRRQALGETSRAGRPPLPAAVKVVNRIGSVVRAAAESEVDGLDGVRARELAAQVAEQIAALMALKERLIEVAAGE